MAISSSKPYLYIGIHILVWVLLGFLLLFYIPLTWNVALPLAFKVWQSSLFLIMIAMFYINAYIVVPRTIIKDKASLFFIWILAVVVILQILGYTYISYTDINSKMSVLLGYKRYNTTVFNNFLFTISLLVLGISTSWAMLQHWQSATQKKLKMEQEKTISELAMLKAQINPHFFFNSLNSIYSLTYSDVEDSRKALHTLSHMMRYLLYNSEGEKTTLSKEIEFIENYISLMKLRSGSRLQIITELPKRCNDYFIAPMLLLPLIENAFKHGIHATQKSTIKIVLKQINNELLLTVQNTLFEKNISTNIEGGIGLTNTLRRLELVYPLDHKIEILEEDGLYIVNLKLTLQS